VTECTTENGKSYYNELIYLQWFAVCQICQDSFCARH